MREEVKYGIWTVLVWNVFLAVLEVSVAHMTSRSYLYIFEDGANGLYMTLFIIAWSFMAYYVGQAYRKEYIGKKEYFRSLAPDVNPVYFDKKYKMYFWSHFLKTWGLVAFISIPGYMVFSIRERFNHWVLFALFLCALCLLLGYYILKRRDRD